MAELGFQVCPFESPPGPYPTACQSDPVLGGGQGHREGSGTNINRYLGEEKEGPPLASGPSL